MSEEKSCCGSKQDVKPEIIPDTPASAKISLRGTLQKYAPVIGVFGLAIFGALALSAGMGMGVMGWMHYAMGLTFLNFALLKMNNIGAFASSFAQYDLLAAKSRIYGLAYPFIEAGTGCAYLAYNAMTSDAQAALYAFTLALTALGAASVLNALKNGKGDLKCACVGGDKDLPLSRVAVAENASMGIMAAIMLGNLIL